MKSEIGLDGGEYGDPRREKLIGKEEETISNSNKKLNKRPKFEYSKQKQKKGERSSNHVATTTDLPAWLEQVE